MLRGFTDSAGKEWRVWEVVPNKAESSDTTTAVLSRSSLKDTAFAKGWLCFETDTEKRRLAPFPSDWESLDPKALEALCAKATPVPQRHAGKKPGAA